MRTAEPFETRKRNGLAGDVLDFCGSEMNYIIQNNDIGGIKSAPYEEWLENNQVYAVFDTEKA